MIKRPVVILPYSFRPVDIALDVEPQYGPTNDPSREADVSSDAVPLVDWAWLVAVRPDLARAYVEHSSDTEMIDQIILEMWRAIELGRSTRGVGTFDGPIPRIMARDGVMDITTYPQAHLRDMIVKRTRRGKPPIVHFVYDPITGRSRLELHRKTKGERRGTEEFAIEAWSASSVQSIGPLSRHLRKIVTSREVVDTVTRGARILLIPNGARLVGPAMVHMSLSQVDGGLAPHFSVREPGQRKLVKGDSPISLKLPSGVTEHFSTSDILDRLEAQAIYAYKKRHKTPAVFLDIDGTLFNVRILSGKLFKEWLADYDGPRADEIRRMVEAIESEKGILTCWNGKTLLQDMGIDNPHIQEEAQAYHRKSFFDPLKRVEGPVPIWGTINFIKQLRRRLKKRGIPLKTVFVSLRSDSDDRLPNGHSAAELSLRYTGLWNELSEPLFYKGPPIDWDSGSGREPEKWRMVYEFLRGNHHVWHVGFFDNTPDHLNGYVKVRGGRVGTRVHIRGDMPPGASTISDGVLSVNPVKLSRELETMGGVSRLDFDDLPSLLDSDEYLPIIERLRETEGSRDGRITVVDLGHREFAETFAGSAVRFLQDLRSIESDIVYLCGHDFAGSHVEARALLYGNGYPLNGKTVSIVMKESGLPQHHNWQATLQQVVGVKNVICMLGGATSMIRPLSPIFPTAPAYLATAGAYLPNVGIRPLVI